MRVIFLLVSVSLSLGLLSQTMMTLEADRDNTIFAEDGSRSGGASTALFIGRTRGNNGTSFRRALIRFNLSSIPAGSQVTSATVRLRGTNGGSNTVSLHKLSADWGEGTSTGSGQGGPASAGDATWTQRFFGMANAMWTTPGGDFIATSSASQSVSSGTTSSFSSSMLIADIQSWIDDQTTNFGWILIGEEAVSGSAVGVSSREGSTAPELSITYTPPSPKVRINEVDPTNQWVELYNGSSVPADIDGWWLCNLTNTADRYDQIGSADISLISGSLVMPPNSYVVLGWDGILNTSATELGLYNTNSFGSSAAIEDYVQYNGVPSSTRANVAVGAGVWQDASHFVTARTDQSHTIGLNIKADMDPAMTDVFDWTEQEPTQGIANQSCGEVQQIAFDIPTGAYGYVDLLISDASIIAASEVIFKAGQEIHLQPTFEVPLSAELTALITCD